MNSGNGNAIAKLLHALSNGDISGKRIVLREALDLKSLRVEYLALLAVDNIPVPVTAISHTRTATTAAQSKPNISNLVLTIVSHATVHHVGHSVFKGFCLLGGIGCKVLSGLLASESRHKKTRAMLGQAVVTRPDYLSKNRQLCGTIYCAVIPAILEDIANNLKGVTIIVRQKPADILEENGGWLVLTNDLLDSEKESAARVLKSELTASLGERLTRKTSAKDIEAGNIFDGELRDVSGKELVIIRKDRLILALVEIVPVSLPSCLIPFASEDTLRSFGVVKRHMEAPDASKQVDESVLIFLGLSRHRI